jgi:LPXTG-motif cell wall-anchored protein
MKKAISLLLALTMTLGLSVVAFAASDIPGTYSQNTQNTRGHSLNTPNAGRYSMNTPNAGNYSMNTPNAGRYSLDTADSSGITYIADVAPATPGGTVTYNVNKGELFLVNNRKVVGVDTELRPDETYKFDIYYANADSSARSDEELIRDFAKLTKADIGKGTVKVRTLKGSSAVVSAKVKTIGSGSTMTYRLEIETRPNYGTKMTDLEYNLNVVDTDTTNTFVESLHTFTVGFNTISDSDTDVGEGGTITISNDAPVILKEQFSDIAKSANYKNIIFESDDGNWRFTGKVAGMKDTNFSYNYDPNTDLLNRFPEHEFKFLNFPAGVNFPTTGEMRIDVSDVSSDFRNMHTYLYRDGKLTEINATYDSGADEIYFRTNYLGRFIVSNERITDTSLFPEPEVEEEEEEYIPVPHVPETPGYNNPNTGAADTTGIMVTLGLVSLASAAAISRKRSK